ncbi:MAG: hypothetical protein OXJ90_16820 [Spirochaetaceae bacterium]|nr:hypothetical protein [Spirochaetaceae bacterium]
MAPLTPAEKSEFLALARSTALREDLRSIAHKHSVDVDGYIAFATTVARLSNHARRPFRPIRGSNFKL